MSRQISRRWPVVLILILGLAIGSWLGNDFGVSWDEVRNDSVGGDALRAYSGGDDYFSLPSLADHGPAYFMFFFAGSRAIAQILPSWTVADGRHLVNFSAFLVSVLCFYFLSRRIVRPPYDWMATALFATQPLLFGYGFIGQKDVSFMAGFMATLALGLAAMDQWISPEARPGVTPGLPARAHWPPVTSMWRGLSGGAKRLLGLLASAAALLLMDLFVFQRLRALGRSTIEAAYHGSAAPLVQTIFNRVATDAYKTTLEAYLAKYDDFYATLTAGTVVLICLALLAAFSLTFPALPERSGWSRRLAGWPAWLGSALALGFTVSMRPVGAFAGLLVSLEALRGGRTRALLPLVAFWIVASMATVATWPYLWPDPILRLLESFGLAAEFSVHSTLFRGLRVGSGNLPWEYFPTLTALQLTETAVLLILLGLFAIAWHAVRREQQRRLIGVILLWVGVPLIVLIGLKTSGYEFRHFLFMLPPLLIIAGIGLELIGDRVRGWARAVLFVAALAPGVLAIAQLHPYEHIYFNTFAGGVSGADGLYQLDRECLSYREATAFVNGIARPGAVVIVPQQTNQVVPFARGDLVIRDISQGLADADFILSCIWRDENDFPTTGFARVYQVRRGTAVLTEVWQREERQ